MTNLQATNQRHFHDTPAACQLTRKYLLLLICLSALTHLLPKAHSNQAQTTIQK